MISEELSFRVSTAMGEHRPTAEQQHAIGVLARFMTDRTDRTAMLLRGSAGTGKTTLAAAIVSALQQLKQKLVLMAPTGRAAKVFALYAGSQAYTIHRRIYRQKTAGDLSAFNLNANLHRDTLFIIDEASMIAHGRMADGFGSGDLLDDLVNYVYSGDGCRMLLIGDVAQLPPVGETEAPALQGDVLRGYGLHVYETDLSEVVRQGRESGILWNATRIRTAYCGDRFPAAAGHADEIRVPAIRCFPDVQVVPGDELIEQLASSYSRVGIDETMVVTRSNKRANIYNQGIRNTVLDREDELCCGDQLMIVKNYYGIKSEAGEPGAEAPLFLANGDRCVVRRVRRVEEMYGFRFAEVTLVFPDYDDFELTTKVLLDTLTSEAPALTREQHEQLYQQVMVDYADVPLKADRLKLLRQDAYYNALQVKYGYAVTCHKAQGGQWAHVYIDQGYMTADMLGTDYLHWLYTAFTRATEKVFLVNWPLTQTEA